MCASVTVERSLLSGRGLVQPALYICMLTREGLVMRHGVDRRAPAAESASRQPSPSPPLRSPHLPLPTTSEGESGHTYTRTHLTPLKTRPKMRRNLARAAAAAPLAIGH
jgi:hypothetical protein